MKLLKCIQCRTESSHVEIGLLLPPSIGSEFQTVLMEVVSSTEAVLGCVLVQKLIMQLRETSGGVKYDDLEVLFAQRTWEHSACY